MALRVLNTSFSRSEKDIRRRGDFYYYWDSNAFLLRTKLGKKIDYVRHDTGITLQIESVTQTPKGLGDAHMV